MAKTPQGSKPGAAMADPPTDPSRDPDIVAAPPARKPVVGARSVLPFLPVDVGGGKVVPVVVCWSPEKTASYLKRWPGGVIDLAELQKADPADTMGRGTHQERCWVAAKALELAGKAPSMHEFRARIAARIAAQPGVALPPSQYRRT